MTPNQPNSFFDPPRAVMQTYLRGTTMQFEQPSPFGTGLRGLGDWASDLLTASGGVATGLLDALTGKGAVKDAQAKAAEVAKVQAAQQADVAKARAEGWTRTLPYLAVGGALVASVAIWAVVKKGSKK